MLNLSSLNNYALFWHKKQVQKKLKGEMQGESLFGGYLHGTSQGADEKGLPHRRCG
jgi:hypothetical protein